MLDSNKIDQPDQLETTEGYHADKNTDNFEPDQRREDEGQRAACAPQRRPRKDRYSVDRSRNGRASTDPRQHDALG